MFTDWPSDAASAGSWVPRAFGPCGIAATAVRGRCSVFVGALAGAILGSALGAAIVLAVYVSDGRLAGDLMLPLAAAYVGSLATLGFQIGGG